MKVILLTLLIKTIPIFAQSIVNNTNSYCKKLYCQQWISKLKIIQLQLVYKIMENFCSLSDEIRNEYKIVPPDENQGYVPAGMER